MCVTVNNNQLRRSMEGRNDTPIRIHVTVEEVRPSVLYYSSAFK